MKKFERNEFGDVLDYRFEFINGKKPYLGDIERGVFAGFTIILKSLHQSTYVFLNYEEEAWDTINNHIENYDKIVAMDKIRSDYLASDEGAWGRQDSW